MSAWEFITELSFRDSGLQSKYFKYIVALREMGKL